MSQEKLIIFSAPSGSGKTTIVKELLKRINNLSFSISATSREKRENEKEGKDYYFLDKEAFKCKIKKDEFLEWEEVYQDQFYGTLKSEVQRIWDLNKCLVFDVDVIGGLNIKKHYPQSSLSLFIQTPSLEELENRLRNRSTESETSLKKRLDKAKIELEYAPKFDHIIINDKLEQAINQAEQLILNFLKS